MSAPQLTPADPYDDETPTLKVAVVALDDGRRCATCGALRAVSTCSRCTRRLCADCVESVRGEPQCRDRLACDRVAALAPALPRRRPQPFRFDRGQGLVEYALIIALVVLVVVAALSLLGPAVSDQIQQIHSGLNGTPPAGPTATEFTP